MLNIRRPLLGGQPILGGQLAISLKGPLNGDVLKLLVSLVDSVSTEQLLSSPVFHCIFLDNLDELLIDNLTFFFLFQVLVGCVSGVNITLFYIERARSLPVHAHWESTNLKKSGPLFFKLSTIVVELTQSIQPFSIANSIRSNCQRDSRAKR